MSGEKRSRLDILQDRLQAQTRKMTNLEAANNRLKESVKSAKQQRTKDLEKYKQEMDTRYASYDQMFKGLKGHVKQMEQAHQKSMESQRKYYETTVHKMKASLEEDLSNLENSFTQKLAEEKNERINQMKILRNWTTKQFEEQRKEYLGIAALHEEQIEAVTKNVMALQQKEKKNENYAKDFIADLEALLEHAGENLPFEKYASGDLDRIKGRVDRAKQSLHNAPQAAIANANEAYFEFVEKRSLVIQKEQQFEHLHQITLETVRTLFENIRKNRKIELEANAGSLEVDYWTQGKFSDLEESILEKKTNLEEQKDKLSYEKVEQIFSDLEVLEQQQQELIDESLERVTSSQLRAEMADVVIGTLERQGFNVMENGYEKDDQRSVYMVKLKNIADTEIVVAIAPDDETHKNTISVNSYGPEAITEEATQERFTSIQKSLKQAGLQMGEITCNEKGIDALYDVENLIKHGGKGIPKKVLEQAKMLNSQTAKQNQAHQE